MQQYRQLVQRILNEGTPSDDRTGTGTLSLFGERMVFDLSEGFPALTLKKLAWKSVVSELIWFLEGSSDERRLAEIHFSKPREELIDKTTIWTDNADKQGKELGYTNNEFEKELGPVYGSQWRNWYDGRTDEYHDQILNLIDDLKRNPYSRRHILSAWNVAEIDEMALPPCHTMCQFYVRDNKLSCQLYQRSADVFLGVPFNIASYALLTHILAHLCGYEVGKFIHVLGDAHIYNNHIEQCKTMIKREDLKLPTLQFPNVSSLLELLRLKPESFVLENYKSHGTLTGKMAV